MIVSVNSRCQVDVLDFQSHSDGKFKFILVYQDYRSKYMILRPLETQGIEEIASVLLDIFVLFGAPCILQSDRGRSFSQRLIVELEVNWPQLRIVDGKSWTINDDSGIQAYKDIPALLRRWMQVEKSSRWTNGLRFIQFMKNRIFCSELGMCPFEAMLGYSPHMGLKTRVRGIIVDDIFSEEDLETVHNALETTECNTVDRVIQDKNTKLCVRCRKEFVDVICAKYSGPLYDLCSVEVMFSDLNVFMLCESCFECIQREVGEKDGSDIQVVFDADIPVNTNMDFPLSDAEHCTERDGLDKMKNVRTRVRKRSKWNKSEFRRSNLISIAETPYDVVDDDEVMILEEKQCSRDKDFGMSSFNDAEGTVEYLVSEVDPQLFQDGYDSSDITNSSFFSSLNTEETSSLVGETRVASRLRSRRRLSYADMFQSTGSHSSSDVDSDVDVLPLDETTEDGNKDRVENGAEKKKQCKTRQKPRIVIDSYGPKLWPDDWKKQSYRCKKCKKQFSQPKLVRAHLCVPGQDPKFQCKICKKILKSYRTLKQHVTRTHTNVKSIECPICKKCMSCNTNLRIHMKIHNKEADFTCGECNAVFYQKSGLISHLQYKHSTDRPYFCPYCSKSFVEKIALKDHLNQHTGETPYECDKCRRMFRHSRGYHKHLVECGNEFICAHCNSYFQTKHSLGVHIKKHLKLQDNQ